MPRGKRKAEPVVKTYEYYLYKHHPSGIGATYVKTAVTTEKPSFDNGYWLDETNHKWAKWID